MTTISRRQFSTTALGAAIGIATAPWPVRAAPSQLLRDEGAAPEFAGIEKWLNSAPLSIQGLAGKAVLVDFWTYSCINCINTLPHVVRWHEMYRDQGLVVVGVHTPEFAFEKSASNVEAALQRFNIRYPVAQDNRYLTWKAYGNQYWPAFYLVGRSGRVMRKHFGEGEYAEMEAAIQAVLAQKPQA